MSAVHTGGRDDFAAACALASEMTFHEAAQFLRAELGYSLVEAGRLAERIAQQAPESSLGKARAAAALSRALGTPNDGESR